MVQLKDAEFYSDCWSTTWRDMKAYSPVGRHTRRMIMGLLKQVEPFQSVADFGCGDGSLLELVADKYTDAKLYGTDFAKESVKICQQRIPSATIRLQDLLDSGRPFEEKVDVAISSEVLEHVADDATALANMAKWSRHLIVTVPGGPLDEMAAQMGHVRHYSTETLGKLAKDAGLEIVSLRAWGFPFAYPWYAKLRNRAGMQSVTGSYGPVKMASLNLLYALFYMNDFFSSGNKILMLARTPE